MSLTELFIRRPALTIVVSLVLTIIGILSYVQLPLRWIPNINFPVVAIYTEYPGASASLIESQISTPIEAALAGIDGIESISSSSKQNMSFVTINFKLGRNINTAVEDVRSALQRAVGSLPKGAALPMVEKADPNGNSIMYLAFSSQKMSSDALSNYVKQFVLPRIQTIEGVATVSIFGERGSVMHIWLDPEKMAAANVTVDDINQTLIEQNIQVPSGTIKGASRYYNIVTNETLKTADEFNDLIIRDNEAQVVRLKDVGQAIVDARSTDGIFRVKGQDAVALGIIPQSNANPLAVSQHVVKEFNQILSALPPQIHGHIVFNQADFIQASITQVYHSLFEATILVLVVILLFLASFRAALIPIVTIPICLITTFALMVPLNISINTITLMAFVLAIGLVVDDAIVMLENITRHIELGLNPFAAAIKGSREMIFPIIAMTITLAAVYAPIAFTSGLLGAVFWEFAMTLAGAVLISGVIALTLSPMMSAYLLKRNHSVGQYEQRLHRFFIFLQERYQQLLKQIFTRKKLVLLLLGLVGMIGGGIYYSLPSELTPLEDMNEIDTYISAPRDASFQYTDSYIKQLEKIYQDIPDIQSYFSEAGFWSPARGSQFISLLPRENRTHSAEEIAAEIKSKIKSIVGVRVNVMPAMSPLTNFSTSDGTSVSMRLVSATDFKNLHAIMQRLVAAAQKEPVFSYVDSSLKWDGQQFEINIDREKAADMKIPMRNITSTISSLLGGNNVGHYEFDGNLYDIIVQMNQTALSDPNIISRLYVRNQNNLMVPLQGLISIKETTNPELLPHFDRLRADTLHAMLAPGYTIADAVKVLEKLAQQILPQYAKYVFEGEAKSYLESSGKMNMTFFLAILFIYLVLVAQFESFIDPLSIMLTVPFAMIGGLTALKLTGGSLNIYSDIALVTLIGLIAKHGILITEFANQLRYSGNSIESAILQAAKLRLRPILMTTAAMVLGALPLALANGAGAETRHQIGWVIVGGLLAGTFFSLIMVPVAYTYLARFKKMSTAHLIQDFLVKENV